MKQIHIFRTGTHTSASGETIPFTEADLQAAAEAYDPALHEAPIVVGHPKDNGPAWGWIKSLELRGENLYAVPNQVDTQFEESVEAGRYKKVSAALYRPEDPNNPNPGTYYLRHVGFLGAQPPAIKGLGGVEFKDGGEGFLEFDEGMWATAGMFRSLRDFFIEKFGSDDADRVLPGYMVESLEDSARHPAPSDAISNYSEGNTMTPEQIQAATAQIATDQAALTAAQTELEAGQAQLETDRTAFNERETAFNATIELERKKGIKARVSQLVKDGKVLPVDAAQVQAFAESLDPALTVEFGEGDEKKSKTQADMYLDQLGEKTSTVDYGEHSADTNSGDQSGISSGEISQKAMAYQEQERAAGRHVTSTQAVAFVMKNPN